VFGMGTGVTLSTKPPENLSTLQESLENRIVTIGSTYACAANLRLLLESKFYGQAKGLISSGQLSVFQRLHTHPINLVVYQESHCQD
jgi:hypothetical protein